MTPSMSSTTSCRCPCHPPFMDGSRSRLHLLLLLFVKLVGERQGRIGIEESTGKDGMDHGWIIMAAGIQIIR